ncbi:geranylgeranylglyceryl/heptaprenylglyceryl phosphate synthase [Nonlabens tegetincola]|uniref:geranylgeranylglyceryl/heptaprenylglyceryl phosphate synthase n=1 Tax=Nonlabens tegetincola TaxID=323273 RepID=UPI000CF573D3|nr:geranylgeranylglyceryl/heptaprenylglyceryl phosphate synthase [Nonlabens tegetincola]PQJ20236.1 hypothetical protein BST93_01985 [Nonlabens tegetincola]
MDWVSRIKSGRSLAILIDPEKTAVDYAFAKAISKKAFSLKKKLNLNEVFFFIGGSTMEIDLDKWLKEFKGLVTLPVIIFPGSHEQVSIHCDALLYLQFMSSRNAQYLIEEQIKSALFIKQHKIVTIPTSYLLIDGGKSTAVQRVTNSQPYKQTDIELITATTVAGELLGHKLVYLEAGSGAVIPVAAGIIEKVKSSCSLPIIVGGGLRDVSQIERAFTAGASLCVVGTAIEENVEWMD